MKIASLTGKSFVVVADAFTIQPEIYDVLRFKLRFFICFLSLFGKMDRINTNNNNNPTGYLP